jgi:hypothetical protein
MKRIFVVISLAVSLVSCKKDRTCSCTSTYVDTGTSYSTTGFSQQSSFYTKATSGNTSETKFNKITKKYGNEACRAETVNTSNYDNTSPYGTTSYITGEKGTQVTTTKCELN